jgi:hypothetical protein
MRWMDVRAWGIVLGVGMAVSVAAQADEGAPLLIAAKVFFKIASYDANLPANEIRVGVAYPADDRETGPEAVRVFQSLGSMRVNGRTISIVPVAFRSAGEIGAVAGREHLYGLFVVASAPVDTVGPVRQVAKENHLFTFAQDPKWVEKGMTAGLMESEGKRQILLNISAATEEGRKFDGAFIGACSVVH